MIKRKGAKLGLLTRSFIIFVFLQSTVGFAQIPQNTISQYSVIEGLPQSTVNCVLRDKTGFLWVGTCGGLSRFDGTNFVSFRSHPDSKNSISDNYVRWLHEDNEGNIWIGTELGLDVWQSENSSIRNVARYPIPNKKNWYIPFYSDTEWLFFADGETGISKVNIQTGQIENVLKTDKCQSVTNITASDGEYCWLFAYGKRTLIRFCKKTEKIDFFDVQISFDALLELFTTDGNQLLMGTNRGLFLYNPVKNSYTEIRLPVENPVAQLEGLSRDSKGEWWIGFQNNQLLVCDNHFNVLQSFVYNSDAETGLYPTSISRIYCDRDENVWVGTDGNGLFKINLSLNKFPLFRFSSANRNQINFIRSFLKTSDGRLYVGTYNNGLFEVDVDNNTFQEIGCGTTSQSPENTIGILKPWPSGGILAITSNGAVICYPQQDYAELVTDVTSHRWFNSRRIWSVEMLTNGKYLAAGAGFALLLDRDQSGKPVSCLIDSFPKRIISMVNIGGDTLFAGLMDKDFAIMVFENNRLKFVEKSPLPDKYRNVFFRSFFHDKAGNVWAATDYGLMKLNRAGEFIQLLTGNDGLVSDNIYGILEDSDRNLWLSTNNGLSKFLPDKNLFINYRLSDGLQSEEFNSGSFYANDGTMYFGGINGFNYFNPESIETNQRLPNIVLTSFTVIGDNEIFAPEIQKQEVKLTYDQNFISVEVAALELTNPNLNEFAFFLKGYDNQWIATGSRSSIRYNNLPPGEFQLWAKGSNCDKMWSEEKMLLKIVISPPFWRTVWFVSLLVLAGLFVMFLLVRSLINRKVKKRLEAIRRKQEIDALRARISRDLHDSAGATLTKISMMGELAKLDLQKKQDISGRLDLITASSRSLVDNFAEIIWATNPQHDNLASLLSYIRTFISEFIDEIPIQVLFDFPEPVPDWNLKPDIRHNIFLIIKESVNNSVKHSKATMLWISVKTEDRILQLKVTDNGIGFDLASIRQFGCGIHSMQHRAEIIGSALLVESTPGKGTTVALSCHSY